MIKYGGNNCDCQLAQLTMNKSRKQISVREGSKGLFAGWDGHQGHILNAIDQTNNSPIAK